ncbi:hypothetical protein SAMN05444338_10456 [Flavobacterium degerlachei]|uniref:Uncharacterized protein n=1 Tax=Flavobacterium degerlachei TaxID=229203 RepID=A0A1H2VFD2_9FLAO|nr:hypothetical protein SAMN05444338_10456 [Flavobacterium degerlachei]
MESICYETTSFFANLALKEIFYKIKPAYLYSY